MGTPKQAETVQVKSITAISSAYGSGQKLVSVAIEYSEPLISRELSADDFEVKGHRLTGVCTSDTARGELARDGHCVQLILDGPQESLQLCSHTGRGPQSRLTLRKPTLYVTQKRALHALSGRQAPAFADRPTERIDRGIAEKFLASVYTAENGKKLAYNLYIPEHLVPGQTYPIVLFIHDAGSCSDSVDAPLMQGTGATVWAIESYYGRRPCFVLAPQYTRACANDSFEVTWETDATLELLASLCESYPIDRKRIYGTGQSMGCMMLCEMILRRPRFFAGCLLVAGQWDPERMAAAKDENLWAVVSSGDVKAFPIMDEAMERMRRAGGQLSIGHIDAQADAAWLDAAIRSQKQKNTNLNFTWFEGRSVIPDGMEVSPGAHHVRTWVKAYDIKALREWMFEQRLC